MDLRKKLGIVLRWLHFTHKLRGHRLPMRMKRLSPSLGAKHGLDFHSASVYVAKKAKDGVANIEGRGRRASGGTTISVLWVEIGTWRRIAWRTRRQTGGDSDCHLLRGPAYLVSWGNHPG